jgi:ankyrin repeat protein
VGCVILVVRKMHLHPFSFCTRALHVVVAAVVRLLLSRGAKQELQDEVGYTALHYAVFGDRLGVVALLCTGPGAAAALALKTSAGSTPLSLAIHRGHAACEAVLRAHGATE